MNKVLIFKVFSICLLMAGLFVPLGPMASLGQILNPYSGIWMMTHNDFEHLPKQLELGLKDRVQVEFESTGIPHIFAENDSDLYFTEGYIQARDRLWEMDFFSRLAAGRLSEVFGKKTYAIDETFVQLRIPEAAEASVGLMLSDPLTKVAIENFTKGVNFFIDHLEASNLPLEFKLFAYKPEHWSPLKTALIAKFMTFSLAGGSKDLQLTRSHQLFSQGDFKELFPDEFSYKESIISADRKWNFKNRSLGLPKDLFQAKLKDQQLKVVPHPGNGSNNWAVFGKKSSTGLPIVSNDIHLDYSLPSLWYQLQLISPSQNVYGASLAGAPGVIVGFSNKFAWAVTNASGDFMDWYELKYQDSSHQKYFFDSEWRKVEAHEHTIFVKGESPHKLILRSTHFGPIVFDDDKAPGPNVIPHGLALRWTALKASNELKSLLMLNQAGTISDGQSALKGYAAPSQNFICADSKGDVSIGQYGDFPLRFRAQGQMVGDGSDAKYQWSGSLDSSEFATEVNPSRNFVFSANQQPMNKAYPFYLGKYYEPPFRAQRIHQLLSEQAVWQPEEIIDMQKDSFNKLAEKVLPILIGELKKMKLSSFESQALTELSSWNYKNEASSIGASIFEELWNQLESQLWSHYFPDRENYVYPNAYTTSELLKNDLKSKWLNPKASNFQEIMHNSLKESLKNLEKNYGHDLHNWQWHFESRALLNHLTRLPFLSTSIDSDGNRYNILANRKNHGPVWKMVVSLGPNLKAWGIYPGGQSGDVRSPHSRDFLKDWAESKLRPLQYLEQPSQNPFKRVILTGKDKK